MYRSIAAATALLMILGAGAAQAQGPIGLELRGGAGFATTDLDDATLKTGGGFAFGLSYEVMPNVRVYTGWDWQRFAMDRPFAGAKYDVETTGYTLGLQFERPLVRWMDAWARAGGIYSHIELEDGRGDVVADSGHELGWEAGGGVRVPLSPGWALTPGVRYRWNSATLDVGQGATAVDLGYVTVDLGVTWTFGGGGVLVARKP